MLTEIEADLFTVPGLDALAHGVNCIGVMGAGIAKEFKRRYPAMFAEYARLCRQDALRPGELFAWRGAGTPWIYNLATQPRPGPCATIPAITRAVERAIAHAEAVGGRRVGMCRLGCGYGGLDWDDVRPALAKVAALTDVDIIVAHKGAP